MNFGMLWLADKNLPLVQAIQKAVEYYAKKYGRRPDMCLVHPSLFVPEAARVGQDERVMTITIDGVTVRPYRPVLPGHIWIGIEDTGAPQESA